MSACACIASPVTRMPSSARVSSSARAAERLVLPLGHRPLGDGDARAGAEGGDDMQGRAPRRPVERAAQRLAVDGEHPVAHSAEVVEKGCEGASEGGGIEQPEHPGEGVVAGQAILQAEEFPQQHLAVLDELAKSTQLSAPQTERPTRSPECRAARAAGIAPPRIGDLPRSRSATMRPPPKETSQNPDQPEKEALNFKCDSPGAAAARASADLKLPKGSPRPALGGRPPLRPPSSGSGHSPAEEAILPACWRGPWSAR